MTKEKKTKTKTEKGFTYICISLVSRKIPCSLYINSKKKEKMSYHIITKEFDIINISLKIIA